MEINGNIDGNEKGMKIFYCKYCMVQCSNQYNWDNHIFTRKHKMEINGNNGNDKDTVKYECDKCSKYFKTNSGLWKHMKVCNMEIIGNNGNNGNNGNEIIEFNYDCDICSKQFKTKSGLWKHNVTCNPQMEINGTDGNEKKVIKYECDKCSKHFKTNSGLWKHMKVCNTDKKLPCDITSENINITEVIEICKNTQQNFKEIILTMMKENKEFQKSFLEIMPNMGNNSHNTNTNSHNTNNFNIQMFLNDHCKNAMNLTDFIQSLPITSETYDNTIENGLTKTITNMMVNGLNELDILKRPIHCTDASRKTLYVKDADNWERDNELLHIMKGIKELSLKQRTMISKWKEANDGWDKDDNLQSKMTSLVFNSMTQIEEDNKETSKIIKAIGKNTYISNEIKEAYK